MRVATVLFTVSLALRAMIGVWREYGEIAGIGVGLAAVLLFCLPVSVWAGRWIIKGFRPPSGC